VKEDQSGTQLSDMRDSRCNWEFVNLQECHHTDIKLENIKRYTNNRGTAEQRLPSA